MADILILNKARSVLESTKSNVMSLLMGDENVDTFVRALVDLLTELGYATGSGGGSVTIINNLESDRTDAALSAAQGKVLKGLIGLSNRWRNSI